MKYKLRDGQIVDEGELREMYYSANPLHNKEVEFGFWLYFATHFGAIKEVDASSKKEVE